MNRRLLNRAEIFAAMAQRLDIPRVLAQFNLTLDELSAIFQEVADHYREQEAGEWVMYCDGASQGNPGPAGAGVVLYDPGGRVGAEISAYLGHATNNIAEYQALLLGLKKAQELGVTRLQIFTDSQLVAFQLEGRYRVKEPHLLSLWQEAKKALQKFSSYAISHLNREANAAADRLARQAIDRLATPE